MVAGPPIVSVRLLLIRLLSNGAIPHLRIFQVEGHSLGRTTLKARVGHRVRSQVSGGWDNHRVPRLRTATNVGHANCTSGVSFRRRHDGPVH